MDLIDSCQEEIKTVTFNSSPEVDEPNQLKITGKIIDPESIRKSNVVVGT